MSIICQETIQGQEKYYPKLGGEPTQGLKWELEYLVLPMPNEFLTEFSEGLCLSSEAKLVLDFNFQIWQHPVSIPIQYLIKIH